MILENEFRVSVPIERAWEVLTDIPLITPCLPGAELTGHEDDEYSGKIKIKVGPVTSNFAGKALITVRDEANRHVEIQADGRDSKGSGNASAKITAQALTAHSFDQEQRGPAWPILFAFLLAKLQCFAPTWGSNTPTTGLRSRRSIFLTESHADVEAAASS